MLRVKVELVTVAGLIASEKVAVALVPADTSTALSTGLTLVTVGGVLSGAAAVVKLQLSSAASGLPAVSLTPAVPPLTVAV